MFRRFRIVSLLAVFSLLAFGETKPVPSQKAFHFYVTYVERTNNGYQVRAQWAQTEYRMHCLSTSESCHMLRAGTEYMADDSKPAGHLVIYGVDDGPTEYIVDLEQELTK